MPACIYCSKFVLFPLKLMCAGCLIPCTAESVHYTLHIVPDYMFRLDYNCGLYASPPHILQQVTSLYSILKFTVPIYSTIFLELRQTSNIFMTFIL